MASPTRYVHRGDLLLTEREFGLLEGLKQISLDDRTTIETRARQRMQLHIDRRARINERTRAQREARAEAMAARRTLRLPAKGDRMTLNAQTIILIENLVEDARNALDRVERLMKTARREISQSAV